MKEKWARQQEIAAELEDAEAEVKRIRRDQAMLQAGPVSRLLIASLPELSDEHERMTKAEEKMRALDTDITGDEITELKPGDWDKVIAYINRLGSRPTITYEDRALVAELRDRITRLEQRIGEHEVQLQGARLARPLKASEHAPTVRAKDDPEYQPGWGPRAR